MKIKKLLLQNINSIYGKWEIDFDCPAFRQSGLFAITGKTGSGKSTILDAVTLALYGVTPRLNTSTAEAVSRGCNECMSELTFTDAGNREWTAAFAYCAVSKGRNKGIRKERAVHRLFCNGRTVAEKTSAVRKMVEEITGLDAIRFCRAVLLAQGAFDAFLNAGRDNGALLEQITGTEIYSRIAARLKERFDCERNKLLAIEAQFAGIRIMPEEEAEEKRREAAELEGLIAELNRQQNVMNTLLNHFQQLELMEENLAKCIAAEKVLEADEADFAPRRLRLDEGRKALEADNYCRPLKELQSIQAAAETGLQKLHILRREQEELCVKSRKELDSAAEKVRQYQKEFQELNTLLAAVRTLDHTLDISVSALAECAAKRRNSTLESVALRKKLQEELCRLEILQLEHREAVAYLEKYSKDAELETVRELCSERQERILRLSRELEDVRRREAGFVRECRLLGEMQKAGADSLAAAEAEFAVISSGMEKLKAELSGLLDGASREHWELLADKQEQCFRQALLLKSLEEHRKQLVPGKACPLCGSEEHPFACGNIPEPEKENKELQKIKTRIAGIGKTEQLLHKNTAELELCRNNISRLQEKQKQLSEQLFSKTADAGEYCRKAQEISAEIALAEEKIAETFSAFGMIYDKENHKLPEDLSSRIGKYAKYKAARDVFESKRTAIQNTLLSLRAAFSEQFRNTLVLKKEERAAGAKLASVKQKRQELFGSRDPDTAASEAEHKREILAGALEELQRRFTENSTNYQRTLAEIEKQEKIIAERAEEIINAGNLFRQACKAAGMTEEMFYASVLGKEEMAALSAGEASLQARRQQLAENRKTWEENIAGIRKLLENQPDREKALLEHERIAAELQEKNQLFGAIREKLLLDETEKIRMAEEHGKLLEQQKVMELWNRMYELIGVKDKFQRFAQGITLEHLLATANIELSRLSDRYRLLRSHKEELGIDVADKDLGDEIRSSNTLSGGERFLVSLALALGLSGMTGEKIRVDSLFLDEGFGTLDAETLDTALEVLNSLRNKGKLIGVISHVAEFAEKIPCRIEVIKQGGGRSILAGPGVKRL